MNKPEDVIQRKLQGFLSVESLSDVATGSLEDGIGTINLNCAPVHSTEADPVMNGRLPLEVLVTLLFIHAQENPGITCKYSESALERRIALYKSNQQNVSLCI